MEEEKSKRCMAFKIYSQSSIRKGLAIRREGPRHTIVMDADCYLLSIRARLSFRIKIEIVDQFRWEIPFIARMQRGNFEEAQIS